MGKLAQTQLFSEEIHLAIAAIVFTPPTEAQKCWINIRESIVFHSVRPAILRA